jgi:hypothetical protein
MGDSSKTDYRGISFWFDSLEEESVPREQLPGDTTAAGAVITHRWGGPLGVPRDWHATASYDRTTGIATAGGYVDDGLSTTNLAGRTLAGH